MEEQKAQMLLKFKRETEVIIARGIRKIMGLEDGADIVDVDTFFGMSEKIMKLAEDLIK